MKLSLKRLFEDDAFGGPRKTDDFLEDARRFFVNYFKQISTVFTASWAGRKYSIRTAPALPPHCLDRLRCRA